MKTILIQGAMEREYVLFVDFYKPTKTEVYGGFKFFVAEYKDHKIVISETQIGIINASEATTIGIKLVGPTITAIFGALEPLTAIVFGLIFFHEIFTLKIAIGIILILTGVMLVVLKGGKKA